MLGPFDRAVRARRSGWAGSLRYSGFTTLGQFGGIRQPRRHISYENIDIGFGSCLTRPQGTLFDSGSRMVFLWVWVERRMLGVVVIVEGVMEAMFRLRTWESA